MIIAGGVNIYPAEIEGEILAHPQVADVAVFGMPDDDMGEQIKAVVEVREGVTADDALRASIMEHLSGRLAKFKWPRTIDFMDELPARAHRQAAEAHVARPVLGRPPDRDLTAVPTNDRPKSGDSAVTTHRSSSITSWSTRVATRARSAPRCPGTSAACATARSSASASPTAG